MAGFILFLLLDNYGSESSQLGLPEIPINATETAGKKVNWDTAVALYTSSNRLQKSYLENWVPQINFTRNQVALKFSVVVTSLKMSLIIIGKKVIAYQ